MSKAQLTLERAITAGRKSKQNNKAIGAEKSPKVLDSSNEFIEKSSELPKDIGNHNQIESALIASETRYRRLFESAKDGILILDAETGMIEDVNPFMIKLLGYSKDQFINKEVWEFGFFDDITESKDKFSELQKNDYIRYENLPLKTANGQKINVEFVSNVYLVDNHKVIQCNIRDITSRKEQEEALQDAKTKLKIRDIKRTAELTKNKQLLNETGKLARVGGWEIDIRKNEMIWSDIVYDIYELEPDYQPSLASNIDYCTPETLPLITDALSNAIDKGKSFDVELQLITAKNNKIWVRIIGNAHRINGEIVKVGGVIHDINERKFAEEQLIIATKELIFQNEEKEKRAAELIIANKELVFQNKEKEKRAAELIIANKELVFQNREKEKRAAELIIANKELVFQNKEKAKRAAELMIANKELIFQNKEKEKRAAELIIANKELVFQNAEKEKRAAELIIANKELVFQNTEKEKRAAELIIAKEKAEESDKLKTAFLQNMSHEIRTPLNGIIGFAGLLNNDGLSKEEIKDFTEMINHSGQRLIEIVNNILDISKIQIGQVKVEQKPILINEIFIDLLTFFSRFAEEKGISLNYHNLDDKSRTIYSDETKLHQILTNLINNAIKFTKSGRINFGYEIKEGIIEIYVKDTGTGIAPEFFDMIFGRFTQADLSITRGYEGAGLGLAICKGLVELLGGKIWIESQINVGSTFFFTLPNVPGSFDENNSQPKISFSQTEKNMKSSSKKSHGKILVAEDDWTSFQYLNTLLGKSDVEVLHAENGQEAVELVKQTPDIDLVLIDIRMPVMDGMDATIMIKQIRPDLPIIAQTAYAFSEEKERILACGCDEYLSKPIKNDKLLSLVKMYLK